VAPLNHFVKMMFAFLDDFCWMFNSFNPSGRKAIWAAVHRYYAPAPCAETAPSARFIAVTGGGGVKL